MPGRMVGLMYPCMPLLPPAERGCAGNAHHHKPVDTQPSCLQGGAARHRAPHPQFAKLKPVSLFTNAQVNRYLNFLPAGYGGSRYASGASAVQAREALETLTAALRADKGPKDGTAAELDQHLNHLKVRHEGQRSFASMEVFL